MEPIIELWLPILVSAVVVFIAGALAWTVLPHHKGDFKHAKNEEALLEALRSSTPDAGQYMVPDCTMVDLKDPEKKKKWQQGPHGIIVRFPQAPGMGKNMVLGFIFYIVVGVFLAYVATMTLDTSATYMEVFRLVGTVGVIAYCFGQVPNAIWFGKPWRALLMDWIDGVVYALLTAGVFGWLWPVAEAVVETGAAG